MSLTLSDGTTSVDLDPDLLWSDEFQWSRVARAASRSITGALIVQSALRLNGRPITLQPEDDGSAWMTRDVVEQLAAWANTPNLTLTLTGLRGESRQVIFRDQENPLDARPVQHLNDVEAGDQYLVTLRLMEI